jgi:hypothetical protein
MHVVVIGVLVVRMLEAFRVAVSEGVPQPMRRGIGHQDDAVLAHDP